MLIEWRMCWKLTNFNNFSWIWSNNRTSECFKISSYDEELEPNNYTIYAYQGLYYTWTKEYGWQRVENTSSVGTRVHVPQRFYDIIQTLVCNYGGEALSKIFINDLPLEIKQIVRYKGTKTLYYNTDTGVYTTNSNYVTDEGVWQIKNISIHLN